MDGGVDDLEEMQLDQPTEMIPMPVPETMPGEKKKLKVIKKIIPNQK